MQHVTFHANLILDPVALKLAERLGGLPLALAIAGAYLKYTPDTFTEYLQAYELTWEDLQQNSPELFEYEGRTLYSTWAISYKQVLAQDECAAKLLQLWAYFDSNDLWHALLAAGKGHAPLGSKTWSAANLSSTMP